MTDSKVGISPEYDPYQNPRPRSGFDNADIGPSLCHVFVFNDTIEGPRSTAVKPGCITQA